MVISNFESDLWHENADCIPIILPGREGYQGCIGYAGTHVPMFVPKLGLMRPGKT